MNPMEKDLTAGKATWSILFILLLSTLEVQSLNAQRFTSYADPAPVAGQPFRSAVLSSTFTETSDNEDAAIPSGTILPVRLNATISSAKCKPGQIITARVMQDVSLSKGAKIREGSKVIGHIAEVMAATATTPGRVSLRFDQLDSSAQAISITTNLRAIAGFMQINEAQTPPVGPSESDVYRWLTTVQVGGDAVYGEGGVVTAAENANLVVGKAVSGGVLSKVRAKPGTKCRGAIDGNDAPQALWVFSSDACGTYGLQHIYIAHAGRKDPTGLIVFVSDSGNVKIAGGSGLLLRVNGSSHK